MVKANWPGRLLLRGMPVNHQYLMTGYTPVVVRFVSNLGCFIPIFADHMTSRGGVHISTTVAWVRHVPMASMAEAQHQPIPGATSGVDEHR